MAYDPEFDIEYPDAPPISFDAPAPAAQIPTQPVGQGSAIGTTGGYDPETGDRYTSQFRYNPVQQGGGQGGGYDDLLRQAYEQSMAFLNPAPAPHGNTPYWENPNTYYPHQAPIDPIQQAKASAAIAYKYIAMRGYQQDLKEGKSAADAFSKWGPMLVADTSFGPAVKAMQGQVKPQWIPGNTITGQPGAYQGENIHIPPQHQAPASIQEVDEIQKTDMLAKQAHDAGNKVLEKQLQDRSELLRNQLKGQEVVTGWDDQGRPIVRVGKGGGGATVATQSQAQQKLLKYENTMEVMNRLDNVLKPEHLGVRGVGGEWIVDKGLQQLAEIAGTPDVGSEGRIESRKLIVALREGLMRELSGDTRFNATDREEISKALPSNGAFESFKDAKVAMNTVRSIIVQRSKNYAQAIGEKPPVWTLSPEEIKSQYKAGKMSLDEAKNALTRFH